MGSWPHFQKCCGFIPLRVGTIMIGIFNLILSVGWITIYVLLTIGAIRKKLTVDLNPQTIEDDSSDIWTFDFFVAICSVLIYLFEAIIAVFILIGINKPSYLRKVIYYMTTLWLLRLLASLVNASRNAEYEAYINALSLLSSAYFILIVRSTRLELEGRLNDSDSESSLRSRSFASNNHMSFFNPAFQPPPNYDEAIRYDPRANAVDTNSQAMIAVLPVVEQTMASPMTYLTQTSKDELTTETNVERSSGNQHDRSIRSVHQLPL